MIVLGEKNVIVLGGKSLCDCFGRKKPLRLFWEEKTSVIVLGGKSLCDFLGGKKCDCFEREKTL